MRILSSILATTLVAGISACKAESSNLVGIYDATENGKTFQFIKIEKSGDGYTIAEHQGDKWRTPEPISEVSKADLEKALKEPVTVPFIALRTKSVMIVKVPVGWKIGKFESKTGYWAGTMFGPIELQKE